MEAVDWPPGESQVRHSCISSPRRPRKSAGLKIQDPRYRIQAIWIAECGFDTNG